MIAIDTNILLRHLVEPESAQGLLATELLERTISRDNPGFIGIVVLVEIIWLLQSRYHVTLPEMRSAVAELISLPQWVVEHEAAVRAALRSSRDDIADLLVHEIGRQAGCAKTITFDNKFARLEGVELLA